MDVSQLSQGAKIAGGAGLLLLISMFLPWYDVSASFAGFSASNSGNAWEVFGFIDLVLFVTAVAAIAVAVMATQNRSAALPVPPGQLLLALGGLATVLVVFRVLSVPDGGIDVDGVDVSRKFGLFVGLIAAAGVAYAGKLLSDE
ncbi:hypothetical protein [Paraconexibacter sp.]|uniref:hypothetical protein n=1 Tax=Paraconexibacter sp. TaxID=2949640 RepID=UPI0035678F49